jgi:hypothetical protein
MKPKTIEQYQKDIEEIERQKSVIENNLKAATIRANQAEKVINLLVAAGLVSQEKIEQACELARP